MTLSIIFCPFKVWKITPQCDFSLLARFDTGAGWLRVDLNWRKHKIVVNKRGPAVIQNEKDANQREYFGKSDVRIGMGLASRSPMWVMITAEKAHCSIHLRFNLRKSPSIKNKSITRLCLEMCLKCPFMSLAKLCDRSTDRHFSPLWFYW